MRTELEKRQQAIALYEAGIPIKGIAQQLSQSVTWTRKWVKRYQKQGVEGLKSRSRRPKTLANSYDKAIRQKVIAARLELEKRAKENHGLKYIGSQAIRTLLKEEGLAQLPSIATIERIIYGAGLAKPRQKAEATRVKYPHLQPTHAHQLVQVDIVPHYLKGGEKIACFNGIDAVSKYPAGRSFNQRRSQDAVDALLHIWDEMGVPTYTQVDNEGCFSGGATHPYVLGRVARLALAVGTQLLFSPVYHPQSNGHVERFHQDYDKHVWDDTYLSHLDRVNQQGDHFFERYRQAGHLKQLKGDSPQSRHFQTPPHPLLLTDDCKQTQLPLYAGKLHFLRRVLPGAKVRVLNVDWSVPAEENVGVWVTLDIQSDGATLSIWDLAPDCAARHCLITHLFPLHETVIPSAQAETYHEPVRRQDPLGAVTVQHIADEFLHIGMTFLHKTLAWSLERTNSFIE